MSNQVARVQGGANTLEQSATDLLVRGRRPCCANLEFVTPLDQSVAERGLPERIHELLRGVTRGEAHSVSIGRTRQIWHEAVKSPLGHVMKEDVSVHGMLVLGVHSARPYQADPCLLCGRDAASACCDTAFQWSVSLAILAQNLVSPRPGVA